MDDFGISKELNQAEKTEYWSTGLLKTEIQGTPLYVFFLIINKLFFQFLFY